jgi:HSP20 family molecular chaperone IbpA
MSFLYLFSYESRRSFSPSMPSVPRTLPRATIPPHSMAQRPGEARSRTLYMRADVHYDPSSRMMTAMLELPGVKKSDIGMTLSRCPFSRVKQLTIRGRAASVFPEDDSGYSLRERRYGDLIRLAALPLRLIAMCLRPFLGL